MVLLSLASQHRAGLLDQFIKSLPVSSDPAASVDSSTEQGQNEGHERPQQVQSALTSLVKCIRSCLSSPVYC